MIKWDIFPVVLLFISAITSLTTEGVKKILAERNINYKANGLVGIVSIVVSLIIGIGYLVLAHISFTAEVVVYLIALMGGSWLCAMVGYDKVIQTITQFKMEGKDD